LGVIVAWIMSYPEWPVLLIAARHCLPSNVGYVEESALFIRLEEEPIPGVFEQNI